MNYVGASRKQFGVQSVGRSRRRSRELRGQLCKSLGFEVRIWDLAERDRWRWKKEGEGEEEGEKKIHLSYKGILYF